VLPRRAVEGKGGGRGGEGGGITLLPVFFRVAKKGKKKGRGEADLYFPPRSTREKKRNVALVLFEGGEKRGGGVVKLT